MTNLFKIEAGQQHAFMTKLAEAGLTAEMAKEVLKDGNIAAKMVAAITGAVTALLRHIGIVAVGPTEAFVAKERFTVDTGKEARARISFLSNNVKNWFGSKVEQAVGTERSLRYAELTTESVDAPILAELGPTTETTLSEIFALMERQKNGEEGVLLANGWANIFYVKDVDGTLRAVNVGWDGDGWDVDARGVVDPSGWDDGDRVFSRNPGA
jgi:hypothetical protein